LVPDRDTQTDGQTNRITIISMRLALCAVTRKNIRRKFLGILIKWIFRTTFAKSYENISKFAEDMLKIPFQTLCIGERKGVCAIQSAHPASSRSENLGVFGTGKVST